MLGSQLAARRCAGLACRRLLSSSSSKYDYDLLVIGGGSGGLACAKEAADLGAKVGVLDYVDPSPQGTSWGLGGTCVNVGCIPKKLMHLAALCGETFRHAEAYGWKIGTQPQHDWSVLADNVQQHIRSLNFGHRGQLMQRNVDYLNMRGTFENSRTILAENPRTKRSRRLTAERIVIAVGGRPTLPQIPGAELGISSDDLFWMQRPPGRTLVIGASYVALECAGLLRGLGFDVSLLVRSICLRGFDQQMAGLVAEFMQADTGVSFNWNCVPLRLSRRGGDGEEGVDVEWRCTADGREHSGTFDTVLFATGRSPVTASLNLAAAGVEVDSDGRVVGGYGGETERSSQSHIFAIGDVLQHSPELTPVAVRAGKLLARRQFSNSQQQMQYQHVPTTVFTPLEYACVGLSEEAAIAQHKEEEIEVYHAVYTPYEFVLSHRDQSQCYVKAVCTQGSNPEQQRVLGLHITGPNAGEIMQGFAALIATDASIAQLTAATVGIHPTSAEEVTKLWITKRSGISPSVTGC